MTWLWLCFSFKGRISRRIFRIHFLCVGAFIFLLLQLMPFIYSLKPIIVPISWIVYYTLIPVGAKRLHDLNHAGWIILLGQGPMLVGIYFDWLLLTLFGGIFVYPYISMAQGSQDYNDYGFPVDLDFGQILPP